MDIENLTRAGEEFRRLRKEKKLSVHRVGRELGVSGSYISLIEKGKRTPSTAVLKSLCHFYNVPSKPFFEIYDIPLMEGYDGLFLDDPELIKALVQYSTEKGTSDEDVRTVVDAIRNIAKIRNRK